MVSLNTEIGTPGLGTSKKGSQKSNPKESIKSYKDATMSSKKDISEASIQDIKIIPLEVTPSNTEPSQEIEKPPQILSNDVSDIYRVINSDIQYKKSKKVSEKRLKNQPEIQQMEIENNNLEKNKQEYMKKIETKITNTKFQNNLRQLDFTDDLNQDDDMNKMKEHVKKLQVIRMEKQRSGVDSSKETPKQSERMVQNSPETLVEVQNVKINLETLGIEPMDSKNNTRPLSIENDFIPDLAESRESKPRGLDPSPKIISKNNNSPGQSNNFNNDFSNKSNTYYEKRNNGSIFDQSNVKSIQQQSMRNNTESEDTTERARKIAEAKGNHYSEDSQKKALFTYGANSSKRYQILWIQTININNKMFG